MKLFLTIEGMERHATGKELYSWHYAVRQTEDDCTAAAALGLVEIADFSPKMPSPEAVIAPVLAYLEEKARTVQVEAQEELTKLRQRKNDLLCLTMAVPDSTEAEGDFL